MRFAPNRSIASLVVLSLGSYTKELHRPDSAMAGPVPRMSRLQSDCVSRDGICSQDACAAEAAFGKREFNIRMLFTDLAG